MQKIKILSSFIFTISLSLFLQGKILSQEVYCIAGEVNNGTMFTILNDTLGTTSHTFHYSHIDIDNNGVIDFEIEYYHHFSSGTQVKSLKINPLNNNKISIESYVVCCAEFENPYYKNYHKTYHNNDTINNGNYQVKDSIIFIALNSYNSICDECIIGNWESLNDSYIGVQLIDSDTPGFGWIKLSTVPLGVGYYRIIIKEIGLQYENSLITDKENESLTLYPNPAQHHISIQNDFNNQIQHINISDCSGKLIKTYQAFSDRVTIDTHDFAPGLYIVDVEYSNKIRVSKKLIISSN
jgi:hypothetical protein